MPEIQKIDDAYIDAVIKATEVYNPNLDVTQGVRLRELIKLMRDHIEQQGDLSEYQTKLSFDETPTADSQNPVTSAGIKAYADEMGTDVKGGVQPEGDTLKKLYDLVVSSLAEVTVETLAERDAYNVGHLPLHIFVKNDGDGNWALYKAVTTGINAQYIKLSDPDTFNSVMNASQIKAAYESNPDTNAFTDSLLQKLSNLTSGDISDLNANVSAILEAYKVISGPLNFNLIDFIKEIKLRSKTAASANYWAVRDIDGQIEGSSSTPSGTQLIRKDYADKQYIPSTSINAANGVLGLDSSGSINTQNIAKIGGLTATTTTRDYQLRITDSQILRISPNYLPFFGSIGDYVVWQSDLRIPRTRIITGTNTTITQFDYILQFTSDSAKIQQLPRLMPGTILEISNTGGDLTLTTEGDFGIRIYRKTLSNPSGQSADTRYIVPAFGVIKVVMDRTGYYWDLASSNFDYARRDYVDASKNKTVKIYTGSDNVLLTNDDEFMIANASAAFSVTLPSPSIVGKVYSIKNIGTGKCYVRNSNPKQNPTYQNQTEILTLTTGQSASVIAVTTDEYVSF